VCNLTKHARAVQDADAHPRADCSDELRVEPLAVRRRKLAQLLDMSERHLAGLNSSGRMPRPLTLGRVCVWRLDEIRRWLDAGAPPRHVWEQMNQKNA
jgi:predicted DNA-binding transcriptional regulator AlpA